MNIGSILSQSFKYAFSNFSKRIREGFPPVLILTIAFNLLDYLISNEIVIGMGAGAISKWIAGLQNSL